MNRIPDDMSPNLIPPQNIGRLKPKSKKSPTNYAEVPKREMQVISLKNILKEYPIGNYNEKYASLVSGIEDIEVLNMNYLAAALYIYRSYEETFSEGGNIVEEITPQMFKNTTKPMLTIKGMLEKKIEEPKDSTEATLKDLWIKRKENILIYLYKILIYFSEENETIFGEEDEKESPREIRVRQRRKPR
jgi:hypothetical protein